MNKVILSLAPVNAATGPFSVQETAEDIVKSIDAGASMCHLHSRDREGKLTPDISVMSEIFDEVLRQRDVVVQTSTGGVSDMNIRERCNPLAYPEAETASLNGGSTNLGDAVYRNSLEDIRYCSKVCYEKKILPEIEVFDIGMIDNINKIREEQPFLEPVFFNLVFGHRGGMQPTVEALYAFKSFVPKDYLWGVTHYGRDNWTFLAAAIAMGAAEVRIGFEDSAYLAPDKSATKNYELVERLAELIHAMGLKVASVAEAREILKLYN